MLAVIRWILFAPALVAVWYAVFAGAIWSHVYVEKNLCPPEDLVSGFCHNSDVQFWLAVLTQSAVALSAALVIGVAVVLAPSHKAKTSWIVLLGGLAAAFYLAFSRDEWLSFVVAAGSGLICCLVIAYFFRRRTSNTAEPL